MDTLAGILRARGLEVSGDAATPYRLCIGEISLDGLPDVCAICGADPVREPNISGVAFACGAAAHDRAWFRHCLAPTVGSVLSAAEFHVRRSALPQLAVWRDWATEKGLLDLPAQPGPPPLNGARYPIGLA
jgi:hypothetical protein